MSRLEQKLHLLKQFDFPSRQFCIAGGSDLEELSKVAAGRGLPPLLAREADDVDIFCLKCLFEKCAHNECLRPYHKLGTDECINIEIGDASYDFSRRWPFLIESIETPEQLSAICYEHNGLLLLHEEHIAVLKDQFRRPKDIADLQQMEYARWGWAAKIKPH